MNNLNKYFIIIYPSPYGEYSEGATCRVYVFLTA